MSEHRQTPTVCASGPETTGSKVGLVASDHALRLALRLLLFVSGFHVREYRSAREYLALPANGNHCVVVDCGFHDLPGLQLCESLIGARRPIPVVALTLSPEEFESPRFAHPAFRVVRKPFDGQALIDLIHKALHASALNHATKTFPPEIVHAGY